MPRWIWSLLVLFAFLALLKRALMLLILARLRLRRVAYEAPGENRIKGWERELLQGASGILSAQGFRFAGYARLPDPIAGRSGGRALAFFQHAAEATWAAVLPTDLPVPQQPFQISYTTCFSNGRILRTRSMVERIFPESAAYVTDLELAIADPDELLAAHRVAAAGLGAAGVPERIGLAALLFLEDKVLADSLEALRARGCLAAAGAEGAYRLTLRGLWIASVSMVRSAPPAARVREACAARGQTFPLPPEAEAEAFLRIDAMGPRLGRYGKGLLILASLAAFSTLSGGGFSWTSGAMLIGIVFIHEMGHALAMRWVGYRDVGVFFVPFFGAVAVGRRERHPGAWKEALILLAGPVPGLAAACLALSAGRDALPDWAGQAALTSLFVNGFNLLPIAPLDGGQLMQLILFRRFPRLNRVFLALSALAIAALAWWSGSPMLGFFAFVLLWGTYKGGQGNGEADLAAVRARYPGGRDAAGAWDAAMISELFAAIRPAKPSPFAEKLKRVKTFLAGPADGLPARPAGFGAALGVFAAYACILAAPLFLIVFPLLGPMLHPPKMIKRADLGPGQARVYDGLCRDASVYRIGMYSAHDTLYLHASVIAPADTERVAALGKELAGLVAMRITAHAPIWGFGGLDSSLPAALGGTGEGEYEEAGFGGSAAEARAQGMDSAGQAYWRDSVEAAQRAFRLRLDSLRNLEAGIWDSWPVERRKEWLSRWKAKRRGGEGSDCFKG